MSNTREDLLAEFFEPVKIRPEVGKQYADSSFDPSEIFNCLKRHEDGTIFLRGRNSGIEFFPRQFKHLVEVKTDFEIR